MPRSPVKIPTGPSTPGPQKIESIQENIRERFSAIIWIEGDPTKEIKDYLSEYDHWEEYDEGKSYSKRHYEAVYTGIMRSYHNCLCVLKFGDDEQYYVAAKRVRSEIEDLESYCTCTTCTAFILNPLKYIWCPVCTGCLKSGPGFAKKEYIEKAISLKQLQNNRQPHKWEKYIKNTSMITICEIATIGIGLLGLTISIL